MSAEEPSGKRIRLEPEISDPVASLREKFDDEFEQFDEVIRAFYEATKQVQHSSMPATLTTALQDEETFQYKMDVRKSLFNVLTKVRVEGWSGCQEH